MEIPTIDTIEITARPVTIHEVYKAVRMGTWLDRKMLLFHPWPVNIDNVRMWGLIIMVYILGGVLVIDSVGRNIPITITAVTLSMFSAAVMYAYQITGGLSERLAMRAREVQEALRKQLQNSVGSHRNEVVEELKQATGRRELKSDPISITAAIIDLIKKNRLVPPPNNNPLRALLDGNLDPRDIDNPTENDENDDFLEY